MPDDLNADRELLAALRIQRQLDLAALAAAGPPPLATQVAEAAAELGIDLDDLLARTGLPLTAPPGPPPRRVRSSRPASPPAAE